MIETVAVDTETEEALVVEEDAELTEEDAVVEIDLKN